MYKSSTSVPSVLYTIFVEFHYHSKGSSISTWLTAEDHAMIVGARLRHCATTTRMATFTRRLLALRFQSIGKANNIAFNAAKRRWYSRDSPALESSDFDFGEYSVILPEEPFVFGVSHITQRPVPEAIKRPPYASSTKLSGDPYAYPPNACLPLGGTEEQRIRKSGALAKAVRDYAGTLVKVRVHLLCGQ